jgi:hypothetical protein
MGIPSLMAVRTWRRALAALLVMVLLPAALDAQARDCTA